MTWRHILVAILALVSLPANLSAGREFPSRQLISLSWLDKARVESDELVVHEGLPHPSFESGDHESELKRAPTFLIGDQALYERPLELSELDRRKLSEILGSDHAWDPPTSAPPPKLCGGFHADYAVTWFQKGKPLARILICFGCGEVRFIGNGDEITTDMTKAGRDELAGILTKYRQERPPYRKVVKVEMPPTVPPKVEPPKIQYKP